MNTACRLIFASCLLLLGIGAGTSDAQVAGASGREEALPLDAPATQLEPVPSAVLPPVDSAVVRPEVRVKVHEVVEPPVSRRGGVRHRRTGPPADHPNDVPGVAPGPDYFYIAGHYVPDGDQVTWKPGFWAKVQPGWDWSPARWVRRPDGWDFRPGSWVRETSALAQNSEPNPRSTVRPGPGDSTSSAVEPQARPSSPEANREEPPPIAGGEIEVGAVPEAAVPGAGPLPVPQTIVPPGAVIIREPQPVVIGRVTGMPYFVVRPPGFPYGPAGVVVPAVVPRFVRNILDRVLP